MLKRMSFLLPLALLVVMMPSLSSRGSDKPDKPAKSTPVITVITATFGDNALTPDRIRSDGGGPYVNGAGNVAAVFQPTGNFTLDTNTTPHAAVRTLFLDFTSCASGPCNLQPLQAGYVDSYLSTDVDLSFAGGMPKMTVGQPVVCGVQINLDTNSDLQWFVNFGSSAANSYPETSQVLVTRTGLTTWTIAPLGMGIARLSSAPTKGKFILTNHGDYYMPFSVTVTQTTK